MSGGDAILKRAVAGMPQTASRALAMAALWAFVFTQLLFRYSMLSASFPDVPIASCLNASESLVSALAIVAIAIGPHVGKRQAFLAAACMAALFLSASNVGDRTLALACLVLVAAAGIPLERLCQVYCLAAVPAVAAIMLLSLTGLEYNSDVIPNSRLVFAYGFSHPNIPGEILFSCVSAMALACWRRRTWAVPLALAIVSALFAYVSLSSHAAAGACALLAAVMVVRRFPAVARAFESLPRKAVGAVLMALPAALLGVSIVGMLAYGGDGIVAWLNGVIHGRLRFAHEYYAANGGITVFGHPYVFAEHHLEGISFNGVDSGYCYLLLVYGAFPLCTMALAYIAAVRRLLSGNMSLLVAAILVIDAVYLLVEPLPLHLAISSPVLMMAGAFGGAGEGDAGRGSERAMPRTATGATV